jgi:hypothetical protein
MAMRQSELLIKANDTICFNYHPLVTMAPMVQSVLLSPLDQKWIAIVNSESPLLPFAPLSH